MDECRPGTGWDSPLAGGLLVYHVDKSSDLAGYLAELDPTSSRWSKYEECVFIIKMKVGDYSAPDTGYSFIDDPGKGVYHVGEEFVPELVETSSDRRPDSNGISWFYDDEPVSGAFRPDGAGTISGRRIRPLLRRVSWPLQIHTCWQTSRHGVSPYRSCSCHGPDDRDWLRNWG